MNSIRYCLVALLLAALGGCADATYEMSQTDAASQQRTTLLDVGYALADDLVKNLHAQIPEGQAVIITSFADVDDLTQSSTVGRMLGEVVGSRLAQQGFTVIDIRARQDSISSGNKAGSLCSAGMSAPSAGPTTPPASLREPTVRRAAPSSFRPGSFARRTIRFFLRRTACCRDRAASLENARAEGATRERNRKRPTAGGPRTSESGGSRSCGKGKRVRNDVAPFSRHSLENEHPPFRRAGDVRCWTGPRISRLPSSGVRPCS